MLLFNLLHSQMFTEAKFSPTDIANLSLWLDASDTSTITEIGGAVSQWDDKSGNNNHATQGTAADQPVTGVNSVNGKNVITFGNGSGTENNKLNLSSSLYSLTSSSYTVFIVKKTRHLPTTSSNAYSKLMLGYPSGSLFSVGNVNKYHGTYYCTHRNSTWGEASIPIADDTNARVLSFRRQGTFAVANVDGTDGNSHYNSASVTDFNLTGLILGGGSWSGEAYDGDILEVMIYSELLTDTEINQVGNYLVEKWGTTWMDM